MRAGRFSRPMDPSFRILNASIDFDQRLLNEDIEGSQAWVQGLFRSGLVSEGEARQIRDGLESVRKGIEAGELQVTTDLEDIHMNVEASLSTLAGSVGEKLHTGRSRNEQVATDLRLHLRARARETASGVLDLIDALNTAAEEHIDVVIPAYTHLQRAQPVLFSHHLLAYAEMFLRDHERFIWAGEQADACPLGAGACVGNQFGIDREYLREALGFSELTHNSMDAVSDRDFVCDFLHAATLFLVHLSRLSEDIVLWSSSEFGFVELDEAVTSGSSMLPQKKNPDACELGRAKCGRVLGHYVAAVSMLKGLPLAYNKDLQEDKEGVFDAIDTVSGLLPVFEVMVRTIQVNHDRTVEALTGGYLEAIGVADYLTRKGVPFRKAHAVAGAAVRQATESGSNLTDLPIEAFRGLHEAFEEDLYDALTLEAALESKDVVGGTAPGRVRSEIERVRRITQGLRGSMLEDSEVARVDKR